MNQSRHKVCPTCKGHVVFIRSIYYICVSCLVTYAEDELEVTDAMVDAVGVFGS